MDRELKLKVLNKILINSRRKNDCLICYLGLDGEGRPRIDINGKSYRVSRVMMFLLKDFDLDSSSHILHDKECSSRACIEINHLKIGDNSENQHDWREKEGRKKFCVRGHPRTDRNLDVRGNCRLCNKWFKERIKLRKKECT